MRAHWDIERRAPAVQPPVPIWATVLCAGHRLQQILPVVGELPSEREDAVFM